MTTMQIDRAVVEQALEALEHHGGNLPWNAFVEVRKDLRAALAQQDEPVKPVATLIAQRDALLEALKQSLEEAIYPSERLSDVYEKARAAIKAVEGEKT